MFSLPAATKMVQFAAFAAPPYFIQTALVEYELDGVSPFGNPRINARLATPRGLSQPATSFFAC